MGATCVRAPISLQGGVEFCFELPRNFLIGFGHHYYPIHRTVIANTCM